MDFCDEDYYGGDEILEERGDIDECNLYNGKHAAAVGDEDDYFNSRHTSFDEELVEEELDEFVAADEEAKESASVDEELRQLMETANQLDVLLLQRKNELIDKVSESDFNTVSNHGA